MHQPVLLRELLAALRPAIQSVATPLVVDCTIGCGGHAAALLSQHAQLRLVGIDKDASVLEQAARNLHPYGARVTLVHGSFADVQAVVSGRSVDALYADFGVNSLHVDTPQRGFSFIRDGPLDMRFDQVL
jgi:16S rRNA (cytosine1402-N4)-methyltransferase